MRLFYFELKVDGKLTNTAVIVGETSFAAWEKFRESYDARLETDCSIASNVFTGVQRTLRLPI